MIGWMHVTVKVSELLRRKDKRSEKNLTGAEAVLIIKAVLYITVIQHIIERNEKEKKRS